jgi:hypothetical protein
LREDLNVLFVEVDSVVVLTTSVTTSTFVLTVLANTTMAVTDMTLLRTEIIHNHAKISVGRTAPLMSGYKTVVQKNVVTVNTSVQFSNRN